MTMMFPYPQPPPDSPKKKSAPVATLPEADEDERVRVWVTERLEEVGLPYPLALELALTRADWHQVKRAWAGGATLKDIQEMFL